MTLALAGLAGPALAQADLFSPQTVGGVAQLRINSTNDETSWVDGGFGKTRFGSESDAWLADGVLEWKPKFGWSLGAVVDVVAQPDQEHPVDFNETYLVYKPLIGQTKVQARLGLFYPPVSLEHDGKAWTTTRTITPSAINSWIGEEVLGAALEVSARRDFGGHELGLTAAIINNNDTAGTLLTFRGWSLNDVKATLHGEHPLPPLSTFASYVQEPETYPIRELDDRFGYYVRADWKPPYPFTLNAIYYDNLGDMIGVDSDLQWSWYTRFVNVGATWQPLDDTELMAQAMSGVTRMGFTSPAGRWFDLDFEAAYLMLTQTYGANSISGRADWFRTKDRANPFYGDMNEHGWAGTVDVKHSFSDQASVLVEVLYVDSDRPGRVMAGESVQQQQTTIQAMARFTF
jgi:hypothetical protein